MLMTATLLNDQRDLKRRLSVLEPVNHSELLEKVAENRCQSSFKALFQYFSEKIYAYGLANQLNETQARDLVQEVMTRVWLKADTFDRSKGEAKTWIFTIARNLRFDFLRKSSRESKVLSSEDVWSYKTQNVIDQDADLESIQQNKELRLFVDQLSDNQKDVIAKVYFSGQTQEEYAKKNEIPLGTVKSRIRLAIRKLNHLMERA